MKLGWLGASLCIWLGWGGAQVGQPGDFKAAIGGLNAKMLIQQRDANTYEISQDVQVKYDPASKSIFVRPIGPKLGDQGLAVAARLLPNWCETPPVSTFLVFTNILTQQMAQSQRLLINQKKAFATRSRIGQCDISTVSNGWDSLIRLHWVGGKGVWPAQQLPAIKAKLSSKLVSSRTMVNLYYDGDS